MGYLRCVPLCFEVVSGLKVNFGKSEMISVGAVDNIDVLAQILGCKASVLPVLYLGLPLGSSFKSKAVLPLGLSCGKISGEISRMKASTYS